MKLKTFDDFSVRTAGEIALKMKLKAEAIKWLKDRRNVKMYICEMDFMEFFNITEEDLK